MTPTLRVPSLTISSIVFPSAVVGTQVRLDRTAASTSTPIGSDRLITRLLVDDGFVVVVATRGTGTLRSAPRLVDDDPQGGRVPSVAGVVLRGAVGDGD